MAIWRVEEIKRSVEELYGIEQSKLLSSSIDSIQNRMDISHFHFHEAKSLMIEATRGVHIERQIFAILAGKSEEGARFKKSRFQASAHILACVQSIHSLADTFSHVLYYAFGMNLAPSDALKPRNVTTQRVINRLMNNNISEMMYSLIRHENYLYISALNNHSKHRSIVKTSYSFDLKCPDGIKHGLKFSDFMYTEEENYAEKWVNPVLESEYDRQCGLIVAMGNELALDLKLRMPSAQSPS